MFDSFLRFVRCSTLVLFAGLSNAQQTDQNPKSQTLSESQEIKAELDNVRALLFGYTARCESTDLKIRSKKSATFVIRDSHLCALFAPGIAEERRHDFLLCSNDPNRLQDLNIPVQKCIELKLQIESV